MKTLNLLLTFCLVALLSTFSFAQITGSAHDFKAETWNTSTEICIVCHTPHNAMDILDAPLWNHTNSLSTFELYSTTTMDATVGGPDGSSALCLGCHDGTVAINNFGGMVNGTAAYVTGDAAFGASLTNDHPISFTYDATLATDDGELFDPSTALSGVTTVGTIADDLLPGGKVQCSSCHDVHNGSGLTHLLVKTNAQSQLCLTCHNK